MRRLTNNPDRGFLGMKGKKKLSLAAHYLEGSAYLQSMDCQREPQSKHPTGENPGIYNVGVPFLVLYTKYQWYSVVWKPRTIFKRIRWHQVSLVEGPTAVHVDSAVLQPAVLYEYDQGRTILMSHTDGRTNDSSGISAAVIAGVKHTQRRSNPEKSRLATSETPQQHSSIVWDCACLQICVLSDVCRNFSVTKYDTCSWFPQQLGTREPEYDQGRTIVVK